MQSEPLKYAYKRMRDWEQPGSEEPQLEIGDTVWFFQAEEPNKWEVVSYFPESQVFSICRQDIKQPNWITHCRYEHISLIVAYAKIKKKT